MKILVRHERLDPVFAPGENPPQSGGGITEEQLNSEAELLKTDDLLQNVVLASGLFHPAIGAVGMIRASNRHSPATFAGFKGA